MPSTGIGIAAAGRFAWVSFDVSADAYLRFMGKYSEPLATQFADLAGVRAGQQVLDVGCGPGALWKAPPFPDCGNCVF